MLSWNPAEAPSGVAQGRPKGLEIDVSILDVYTSRVTFIHFYVGVQRKFSTSGGTSIHETSSNPAQGSGEGVGLSPRNYTRKTLDQEGGFRIREYFRVGRNSAACLLAVRAFFSRRGRAPGGVLPRVRRGHRPGRGQRIAITL